MTSYGLPSDPGKYSIVAKHVVFEANKIKFKRTVCEGRLVIHKLYWSSSFLP